MGAVQRRRAPQVRPALLNFAEFEPRFLQSHRPAATIGLLFVVVAVRGRNATLASLLAEVGWSPYELARAVNRALDGTRRIHPTTPFTWRDHGVIPRNPLPSVIAGVLTEACGRAVTAQELWPDGAHPSEMYSAATAGLDTPWSAERCLTLFDEVRPSRSSPRRFFALSGNGLIETARIWTQASHGLLPAKRTGPGTVTPELIDYLVADIASLRRLDDGHSGQLVLRTASYHLGLAIDLLAESRYGAHEGRLLASLVGQLAQLVGWLNFDLGNHGDAQRLYLLALRAASLAGDRAVGALVLSSLALQQSWRDRPNDAITLLNLARGGLAGAPSPRVRALLAMREARAHATANQEASCRAAITLAEQALDQAPTDGEPPWIYWLDRSVLTNEIGRCLLRLDRPQEAQEHLNRGIGMLNGEPSRDRILYGLSLAHALSSHPKSYRPDVELACHEARQVLPMMQLVSSQRCHRLLGVLTANLRRHRTSAVRLFMDEAEGVRPTGL